MSFPDPQVGEPVYVVFGSDGREYEPQDRICGICTTLSEAQEAKSQVSDCDTVWIETWSTGPKSAHIEKDFYVAGIYLKYMRYADPSSSDVAAVERLPSVWGWSLGNIRHEMVDASEDLTHRDHTSAVAVWRGGFTEAEAQSRLADAGLRVAR